MVGKVLAMTQLVQSGTEVGDSSGASSRAQVARARAHHVSKIPRRKPAPGPAQASRKSGSENFDSIADSVVGEIIKKACQTVEDRREEVEGTEEEEKEEQDDIWPTNEEYNIERGKAAINKCLSNR